MTNGPLKGVNLGGWLVLERWITPGLFKGTQAVDEYTYCQQAGKLELKRLKEFRDTFITREDFVWLAEHGVQAVRLPVGYWMFGGEEPYVKTLSYVDKVFEWAEGTGLKVLLDLHGARGSQNGRDHSGHKGMIGWHKNELNIEHSLKVIESLALRYHISPALLGVSLLNEPHVVIPKQKLVNFYEQSYRIIRDICGPEAWVVYSDGYLPSRWGKQLPLSEFPDTYIDTHHYQIYALWDRLFTPIVQLWRARWQLPWVLRRLRKHHPVIVGEWCLTLDDKKLRKLKGKKREAVSKSYAAAQLQAYRKTSAWFFWTYKTEYGGTWSFRDSVEKDLL